MIPARRSDSPPRVLVVDDSRTIRMILARSLRALGCEVFEAGGGEEALATLRKLAGADLLLVDLNMPGMDGCELVRAVRADAALAQIPALMVTATTQPAELARAQAAGASGHLAKPFTLDDLRERLAGLGLISNEGPVA